MGSRRIASMLTVALALSVLAGQLAVCSASSCCESHGKSEDVGGRDPRRQAQSEAAARGVTHMTLAVLNALESGDPAAFERLVDNERYLSNGPHVRRGRMDASGSAGSGTLLGAVVDVRRTLRDGDYIVAHSEYVRSGERHAGLDVFRLEDELVMEHWGGLQAMEEAGPSGRTMLDGPVVPSDLDKTEENKALVEKFVREVLIGRRPDALAGYFDGDAYVQHSPNVDDGVSSFAEALTGGDAFPRLEGLHLVVGQGDLVLVLSEGRQNGERVSSFNLFRVQDGFIAEHWDIVQAVLPAGE
jgi:predicted SnoaL-like aldol condensation-catalyzing enzyme